MTDAKRKMHLAIQAASPGHPAGWRVPGGERQGDESALAPPDLDEAGLWQQTAVSDIARQNGFDAFVEGGAITTT